ncbi:hypothetical protein [Roseiconus lacunae]|uniref:Uncharacterized protein n=1 Tax=Roseiconus lacunae TaxID=2605694 RepID=A0ABT7PP31_9BACT|nr:hypothetical protein [Roseiconus lacunae]MDM4018269.1 hypothetical protein [Roseiconus lacunae]WRQ53593.1 hypothetical protein U8335_13960 [Stieleria sp. HD01]
MQEKRPNNDVRSNKSVSDLENKILDHLTTDRNKDGEVNPVFPTDFSASGSGKGGGGNVASIEQ